MTSANFHVCYASVADALFEHIEQDLLLLTSALIDDEDDDDDDEDRSTSPQPAVPGLAAHDGMPPP